MRILASFIVTIGSLVAGLLVLAVATCWLALALSPYLLMLAGAAYLGHLAGVF